MTDEPGFASDSESERIDKAMDELKKRKTRMGMKEKKNQFKERNGALEDKIKSIASVLKKYKHHDWLNYDLICIINLIKYES